jgi:hypothetical protein
VIIPAGAAVADSGTLDSGAAVNVQGLIERTRVAGQPAANPIGEVPRCRGIWTAPGLDCASQLGEQRGRTVIGITHRIDLSHRHNLLPSHNPSH